MKKSLPLLFKEPHFSCFQKKCWLFACTLIIGFLPCYSANISSAPAGGDWNTAATWVGGVVPVQGDNVTVTAASTVTLSAAAACTNLILNGTVTMNNAGIILKIGNPGSGTGTLTLNAGGSLFIGSVNTVEFVATQGGVRIQNNGGTIISTGINGTDGGTVLSDANSGGGFEIAGNTQTVLYNLKFVQNANFNISATPTIRINGTFTIPNNNWGWNGGSKAPVYGPGSTVYINNNGQGYAPGGNRFEWLQFAPGAGTIAVTPGYPNNVTIVDLGNSMYNGSGFAPAGDWSINGILAVGDATNPCLADLTRMTSFVCGGIRIDNASVLKGSTFKVNGSWGQVGAIQGVFQDLAAGTITFTGTGTVGNPDSIYSSTAAGISFGKIIVGSTTQATYIKLKTRVTVSTNINLVRGIIESGVTNLLYLTNVSPTTAINTSNNSFVNGPLKWDIAVSPDTSPKTYIFPVGSGTTYLPLTLNPNSTNSNTATVQAFAGNANGTPDGTTVTSLSTTEYWSMQTTQPFTNGANVSVTIPTPVSPAYNMLAMTKFSAASVYSSVGGTVSGNSIINAGTVGTNSPWFFVLAYGPFTLKTVSVNNPTCTGTVGSVTVGGSGGTPPYTYAQTLAGPYTATQTYTGLAAGTYVFYGKDATGTLDTDTVILKPLTLIADTATCAGNSIVLTTTGGYTYSWTSSPAGAFTGPTNIASPTATPTVNTTYYVTALVLNTSTNLIVNGDFEAATPVTSDYINVTSSTHLPYANYTDITDIPGVNNSGIYVLAANANNMCQFFANFTDHTSGSGKMLVSDAVTTGGATKKIWTQTVAVAPNTDYVFQYYYSNATTNTTEAKAQIQTQINGTPLPAQAGFSANPFLGATNPSVGWQYVACKWSSGANTSAVISLFDPVNVGTGNDFCLDDMAMFATCTAIDSVQVKTGAASPAPATSPVEYCKNAAAIALTAGGVNLKWYNISNVLLAAAPVPSTTTAGTTTYYVTQTIAGGCAESPKAAIVVKVTDITAPIATGGARCGTGTVSLTAALSGAATDVIKWYSDAALTIQVATGTNFTTPSISASTTYYITETSAGGCISTSAPVTATINPGPAAPTGTGAGRCGTGTVTLTAMLTGGAANVIKWYSDAALTTQVATGTSFTTPSITATTNYYITESTNSGCASTPVMVTATINQSPSIPTGTGASRCGTGTVTLTASLSGAGTDVIKWYSNAALTTQVASGNSFTTASISTTTNYYITQTNTNNCASTSVTVTATVNPIPSAPTGAGASRCGTGTLTLTAALSGTGTNVIKWYSDAALTTQVATGTGFITPNISATTNYYITETNMAGCVNAVAATVTATINPGPAAPAATGAARCGIGTVILTATLTSPGNVIKWYNDAGLTVQAGSGTSFTTALLNTTSNYYVTETNSSGCSSTPVMVTATINQVSAAPAVTGASKCGTGSVTLTAALSGAATDVIKWYSDATLTMQVASGTSFTTPSLAATTNYYVTETSSAGCISLSASVTATINPLPTAGFTAAVDCGTRLVTFNNTSNGNGGTITEWTWNFDDGSGVQLLTNAASFTWPYPSGGSHHVTLTVKTASGCSASTAFTQTIVFGASPVADFSPGNLCQSNSSSTFTNSSTISDATLMTYSWDFGDNTALVQITPAAPPAPVTHSFATGGNYTVTLTATSAGGCVDTKSKLISIVSIPDAHDSVVNGNLLCSYLPVKVVNFSAVNGQGTVSKVEVFWDYPDLANKSTDNQPATGNVYIHQYPAFGAPFSKNYNVVVRAYNSNGCFDDSAQVIAVLASPKIQLTPLASVCVETAAMDISASATALYGLGGTGIHISGDGINGNLFSASVAGTGTHNLHYTDTASNGCATSADQSILVLPDPVSKFNNEYTVLENGSIRLQPVSPMSPGLTYQWMPATFLDNANAPAPTVINPSNDITYKLTITAGTCSIDTTVTVTVLLNFIVPNTFTPNNDGAHDRWIIKKLAKYPNHRVQVFNRYGQVVYETSNFPLNGWDGTYKGKSLIFGTYYYVIELGGLQKSKTGYVTILK